MTGEQKNKEKEIQGFTITEYRYNSSQEALAVLQNLGKPLQEKMAEVYRDAFGGAPWFEQYFCNSCDDYRKIDTCSNCGTSNLRDAYPVEDLLSEGFPNMVSEFIPGVLLLAATTEGKLVGFSTGGFTTVENLVKEKYKSNTTIYEDLLAKGNITSDTSIFYDNETCILPEYQNSGIGRQLSQVRITAAIEMGAEYICGRTINLPWLGLKEKQLTSQGYTFESYVLNGDTYKVDDTPRTFYLAGKIK